jgi:membrane fusion protein (multidrug efflux system)
MSNTAIIEKKKSPIRFIILAIVLLVAGWFGYKKVSFAMSHETTDNAQIETQITPVLPRVSGYVKAIAIKDYDSVKKGELLVELDDAEMQLQLVEMEADYHQAAVDIINAKASLNNASVTLGVNRGNIDINTVKLKKAVADLERDENLFKEQAITKKQLEDSKFNYQTALQQVQNSNTDLTAANSRIPVLQSSIQKTEAALASKKAKIDEQKLKITYTKIFAPSTGKIGKKNVSEGQFVQAGAPLFSIVNDTTYWIIANFKETQIRKFHVGMSVDIELDAFPDTKIEGIIESLSEATGAKFAMLPPDNSSGNFVKVTQRVPVRIAFKNIEEYKNMLRAGLSAGITISTK